MEKQDLMGLLSKEDVDAIEYRSKFVIDYVNQLRACREEAFMTLTNSKDSKDELNEKEEYLAKNHIFSEYIQLNTYESIKQMPQHTSQLSSNNKQMPQNTSQLSSNIEKAWNINDSIELDFKKELN